MGIVETWYFQIWVNFGGIAVLLLPRNCFDDVIFIDVAVC